MVESNDEQLLEEGYLTKEERFDRAQRKLEYARDLRLEAEAKKEIAKSLSEQAKGAEQEAHALICDKRVARPKEDPQLSIPPPDPTICPEAEDGVHEWIRLSEVDGVLLDQCNHCDHERTAKAPDAGAEPAWLYLPSEPTTEDRDRSLCSGTLQGTDGLARCARVAMMEVDGKPYCAECGAIVGTEPPDQVPAEEPVAT